MATEVLNREVSLTQLSSPKQERSTAESISIPECFVRAFSAPIESQDAQRIVPFKYDSPLDRMGFIIQNQINSALGIYRNSIEAGLTHEQALNCSLAEIEMNIRGYTVEYSKQGLVFPHLVALEEGKLVNSYNHQSIIPHISSQERGGAVLFASMQMQEFLDETKEGTVVMTSPMGGSGIRLANGEELEYCVTQTFVYIKQKHGSLEGVTLVTDMTEAQNRELMLRLGIRSESLGGETERERVENIVRNPVLLSPFLGRSISPEDVLELILDIRGSSDIRLVNAKGEVEYRPMVEMRRDLAKRGELLKFNSDCEKFIDNFKRIYLKNGHRLNSGEAQYEIATELEEIIFLITREVNPLNQNNGRLKYQTDYSLSRESLYQEFSREIAILEKRVGCAGGGSGSRDGLKGFLMSSSVSLSLSSESSREAYKCLSCGEVNICSDDKCYACNGKLVKINRN